MKVTAGFRKICSQIWHSAKNLETRKVQSRVRTRTRGINASASDSKHGSANHRRMSGESSSATGEVGRETEERSYAVESGMRTVRGSRRKTRFSYVTAGHEPFVGIIFLNSR